MCEDPKTYLEDPVPATLTPVPPCRTPKIACKIVNLSAPPCASHSARAVGSPAALFGAVGSPNVCALLVGLASKSRGVGVVHYVRYYTYVLVSTIM